MLDRLQRRDLQPSRRCGRCSKRRATGSARHATPKRSCTRTRNTVPRASSGWKACSRSRSTTAAASELFAARDRLGKKPFFYTVLDGVLLFRQRAAGTAHVPPVEGRASISSALEGYLSLGYFLAPATIYRDVYKLLPGHWLRVADGRVEDAAVLGRDANSTPIDRPTTSSSRRSTTTLRTAVHDRLESEVPLGAFLSGGIDSGLVVSYMAEALGDRLVTASVGFGERAHNELEAAGVTAAHFRQPALRRDDRAAAGRRHRSGDDAAWASRWRIRRRFPRGMSRARRGVT